MTLVWTRVQDGEHNGKPCYDYHATCENRMYHITYSYDGGFGFTARCNDKYLPLPDGGRAPFGLTWLRTLTRCKAACEAIDKREMAKPRTVFVPQIAGTFTDFDDWVRRASRTIGERFCPKDTMGHELRAICVDILGRRCQIGGDFHRARDEKTFPVSYFWDLKPVTFNGK